MSTSRVIASVAQPTPVDFRSLFEQQFDYVLRTLRFLGVGASDLEDVAHDVFLHVYRHLADYEPSRPIKPWLYCFMFRIARDFRVLTRHREALTDDFSEQVDERPHPDAIAMRQQLQIQAMRALEELDAEERGVFVAVTLDELTAPETSEALGIPLNTVYSRLRRARTKFDAAVRRISAREKSR